MNDDLRDPGEINALEHRLALLDELGDDEELDLGTCHYFLGVGSCTMGCWEEPSCMTSRPSEGWPSEQQPPSAAWFYRMHLARWQLDQRWRF